MNDYFLIFFIVYIISVFLSKKKIDKAVMGLDGFQKKLFFQISNDLKTTYRSIGLSLIALLLLCVFLLNKYSIYGYMLFFLLCFLFHIIYLSNLLKGLKGHQFPSKFIKSISKAIVYTIAGLSLCVISLIVAGVQA
jgi:hypothetical protein